MNEKFPLGEVAITSAAQKILAKQDGDVVWQTAILLARHHSGDWGDLSPEEWDANEFALENGTRLMSVYGKGDEMVYVVTEANRSLTTIMTPQDFETRP